MVDPAGDGPAVPATAAPVAPVAPFGWTCRRSGRCCRVSGYVWLAPDEDARLAAARGAERDAFRRLWLRTVLDPRTGGWREALRERADGSCVLLEGTNECSVYEARPEHCRRFPYWDDVLRDPAALERVRAVCPGIEGQPAAGGPAGGGPR